MSIQDIYAWWFHISNTLLNNWYLFALTALVLYGIYQYLLDFSVESDSSALTNTTATCVLIVGGCLTISIFSGLYIFYLAIDSYFTRELLTGVGTTAFLGILQGILFLMLNIFRSESRKVFPNHVVLPITRANVILVILASWFLFDELAKMTMNKLVGFALIGASLYLLKDFDRGKNSNVDAAAIHSEQTQASPGKTETEAWLISTLSLILATLASAASALLSKFAVGSLSLNIALFIFFSNFFTCFSGYFLILRKKKSIQTSGLLRNDTENFSKNIRNLFVRGMGLGLINLIAFACLLNALALTDASIVFPIYSLYIVIPILLATVVQGDKLTDKITVGVVLSVTALIMLG